MSLLRTEDPTLAAIQRRAFCHFATTTERSEQMPAPEVGTMSVIGTVFQYWSGTDWVSLSGGTPGVLPEINYVHHQGTTAATWTIDHDLGFQPTVTVIDSSGAVVEGDIAYPNTDTVVLTFSAAFTGIAYLS